MIRLFQDLNFSVGPLGICGMLESIKYFFEGKYFLGWALLNFPYMPICPWSYLFDDWVFSEDMRFHFCRVSLRWHLIKYKILWKILTHIIYPLSKKPFLLFSFKIQSPKFSFVTLFLLFLFMNISFRRLITHGIPHLRHKIIIQPVFYSFSKLESNMSTLDIICKKITDLSDVDVQTKHLEEVSMMIESA